VKGKTVRPAIRFLLGLFVVALIAALSMMRLDPRFLIAVLPIEVVGALYFFYRVIPTHWRFRGIRLPLLPVIAVIGFLFAIQSLLDYVSDVPAPRPALIEANEILRAGGMRQAQEVISTELSLQDLSSLSRMRFPQAYWVAPTSGTLDALIETAHTHSFRFLIYDKQTGPAVYPNLAGLLSPESRPAGLTPIYLEPQREFAIYRIDDVLKEPTTTVAMLEQDITLQQAQIYTSRAVFDPAAREVGLYLYWRAGHKLQSSFKVFVHILDESGQLVAQDDGIPVLWTYPTSMWKIDETVVDFHRVRVAAIDPHKSYTLVVGMYNETTGDRLNQVDASGNIIDDKIVLEKSFLTTESLASQ
jgi:hypothetical protein